LLSRLKLYWELSRPFTLLAPAVGILSGGITALGASPRLPLTPSLALEITLGTLMAAVLNAASNTLNQIYDLAIDRVNKPRRPIPSGRIGVREAGVLSALLYAGALALALLVNVECFVLASLAALGTIVYSVPPFRTKRLGIWANVTIAIPRGLLLKVAGWSTVRTVLRAEPWFIGLIFGLFLLGASSTKDFADIEGDRKDGCETLPIRYGVRRSAWMISPSFFLPFLLMPLGARLGVLTGNPRLLSLIGFGLAAWGLYVTWLMLRRPEELATDENHVSWRHMYLMMLVAQIGFNVAYLM
jgi:4-hydroxybenzoate polyprenyltransferase